MNTMKLWRISLWLTTPVTLRSGKLAQRRRDQVMHVIAMGAYASDAWDRACEQMRNKFPGAELRNMQDGSDPWTMVEIESGVAVLG